MNFGLIIAALVVGYLIGNVNFAKIIAGFKKVDITKQGSGNPGTMNMVRTLGIPLGVLTLVLEVAKGLLGAWIGYLIFQYQSVEITGAYIGGAGVVLGQVFPAIYKFKGGKGVGCLFGVMLFINPFWAFIAFLVGVTVLVITDYGFVGSFAFILFMFIFESIKWIDHIEVLLVLLFIVILIVSLHASNIKRLVLGKENKMNFKKLIVKMFKKEKTDKTEVVVEAEKEEPNKKEKK